MSYQVGKNKIEKHCYNVYVRPTQWTTTPTTFAASTLKSNDGDADDADWADGAIAADSEWGLIGQLDESPSIKISEGESQSLASCNDKTISENIDVALRDLQVTAANYNSLRTLFKLGNVDILFYDSNAATESLAGANIGLMAFFEGEGNSLNGVVIEGNKEIADSDDAFAIIEIT